MKDEELLRELGRVAREEESGDARLSALARGELSAAERAELESLAAGDPAAARALDAYRPFDEGELDRIAAAVVASPRTDARPGVAALSGAASRSKAVARERARGRLASLVGFGLGAPLAAAAAALLWFSAREPTESSLPRYEVGFASAVRTERAGRPGELEVVARLDPRATFEMVVRPEVVVRTKVAARAALVRDGHASPWQVPLDVSPEGAVHVVGASSSLFPETRGTYEVVVAVAAPDALPAEPELSRIAESDTAAAPPGVRVVRGRVVFVE